MEEMEKMTIEEKWDYIYKELDNFEEKMMKRYKLPEEQVVYIIKEWGRLLKGERPPARLEQESPKTIQQSAEEFVQSFEANEVDGELGRRIIDAIEAQGIDVELPEEPVQVSAEQEKVEAGTPKLRKLIRYYMLHYGYSRLEAIQSIKADLRDLEKGVEITELAEPAQISSEQEEEPEPTIVEGKKDGDGWRFLENIGMSIREG